MKKRYLISLTLLAFGCASYQASPLTTLSTETIETSRSDDVVVLARAFDRSDCRTYLDRDVIGEGYQPVQIYIQNDSKKSFAFSLNRLSLSCARPEEVAEKVHTSTVGRAVGYGVGALFIWPLAIPAIVDGIKSSKANDALDTDFNAKTARDGIIFPHSHVNRLIFVPVNQYQPSFELTLIEQDTQKARSFNVAVQ